MISAFYKFTPSKRQKITRQKHKVQPFMIPKQHLIDNEQDILRLKKQCLKYQRQFTFIKNQIERQARLKKQKSREHFEMDKAQLENALQSKSPNQNRQERRRQLGITERELEKHQQKDSGAATRYNTPLKTIQQQIIISSVGICRKINK